MLSVCFDACEMHLEAAHAAAASIEVAAQQSLKYNVARFFSFLLPNVWPRTALMAQAYDFVIAIAEPLCRSIDMRHTHAHGLGLAMGAAGANWKANHSRCHWKESSHSTSKRVLR